MSRPIRRLASGTRLRRPLGRPCSPIPQELAALRPSRPRPTSSSATIGARLPAGAAAQARAIGGDRHRAVRPRRLAARRGDLQRRSATRRRSPNTCHDDAGAASPVARDLAASSAHQLVVARRAGCRAARRMARCAARPSGIVGSAGSAARWRAAPRLRCSDRRQPQPAPAGRRRRAHLSARRTRPDAAGMRRRRICRTASGRKPTG